MNYIWNEIDVGCIVWPPIVEIMLATLVEDEFYVGTVCGKFNKDGSIRVNYMIRYLNSNKDERGDKF